MIDKIDLLLAENRTLRNKACTDADEIERLRGELEALSYIHDGNPSLAMADMEPLDYARYMLAEVRDVARAALKEQDT